MMEDVYKFIEHFGGNLFWTGVINLFFFAGLGWTVFKNSAGTIAKFGPAIKLGKRARLAKLRRFREIASNAKYGATPYVASVLEWRNCVRWLTQFFMNTIWFALNALLAADAVDPTINRVAMALIGVISLGNLIAANRAADRAWEHAHWTAYPQAWRNVLLAERVRKPSR